MSYININITKNNFFAKKKRKGKFKSIFLMGNWGLLNETGL